MTLTDDQLDVIIREETGWVDVSQLARQIARHFYALGLAAIPREPDETATLDKTRLDWLEMHGVEIGVSASPAGNRLVRWWRGDAYGETVRSAIDTAMQQMDDEGLSTKEMLLFSNDWLRKRIASDPDDGPEAGLGLAAIPGEPNDIEKELRISLGALLAVITVDRLIPETVSYMKQARNAIDLYDAARKPE